MKALDNEGFRFSGVIHSGKAAPPPVSNRQNYHSGQKSAKVACVRKDRSSTRPSEG
jgi:hypothetical protein